MTAYHKTQKGGALAPPSDTRDGLPKLQFRDRFWQFIIICYAAFTEGWGYFPVGLPIVLRTMTDAVLGYFGQSRYHTRSSGWEYISDVLCTVHHGWDPEMDPYSTIGHVWRMVGVG
jgi:hypothetical protein